MHLTYKRKASVGLTIVEFLIALLINILLLSALISMMSSNAAHYTTTNKVDMLNQQLQVAISHIANDLRRAGYWANANTDINTGQNNNPFMSGANDITINGSCILFTYDANKNGSLSAVNSGSDDEHYGFRLNNQNLQVKTASSSNSCNAAASDWENMTDPNIVQITALSFTLNTSNVPVNQPNKYIVTRGINISITGQFTNDPTVTKTITHYVKVRNDKFVP